MTSLQDIGCNLALRYGTTHRNNKETLSSNSSKPKQLVDNIFMKTEKRIVNTLLDDSTTVIGLLKRHMDTLANDTSDLESQKREVMQVIGQLKQNFRDYETTPHPEIVLAILHSIGHDVCFEVTPYHCGKSTILPLVNMSQLSFINKSMMHSLENIRHFRTYVKELIKTFETELKTLIDYNLHDGKDGDDGDDGDDGSDTLVDTFVDTLADIYLKGEDCLLSQSLTPPGRGTYYHDAQTKGKTDGMNATTMSKRFGHKYVMEINRRLAKTYDNNINPGTMWPMWATNQPMSVNWDASAEGNAADTTNDTNKVDDDNVENARMTNVDWVVYFIIRLCVIFSKRYNSDSYSRFISATHNGLYIPRLEERNTQFLQIHFPRTITAQFKAHDWSTTVQGQESSPLLQLNTVLWTSQVFAILKDCMIDIFKSLYGTKMTDKNADKNADKNIQQHIIITHLSRLQLDIIGIGDSFPEHDAEFIAIEKAIKSVNIFEVMKSIKLSFDTIYCCNVLDDIEVMRDVQLMPFRPIAVYDPYKHKITITLAMLTSSFVTDDLITSLARFGHILVHEMCHSIDPNNSKALLQRTTAGESDDFYAEGGYLKLFWEQLNEWNKSYREKTDDDSSDLTVEDFCDVLAYQILETVVTTDEDREKLATAFADFWQESVHDIGKMLNKKYDEHSTGNQRVNICLLNSDCVQKEFKKGLIKGCDSVNINSMHVTTYLNKREQLN